MPNQLDPQYDAPLFSHPEAEYASATPGSAPVEDQRAYTGLFQEPADGAENDQSAA
jgi:hypothetical protein